MYRARESLLPESNNLVDSPLLQASLTEAEKLTTRAAVSRTKLNESKAYARLSQATERYQDRARPLCYRRGGQETFRYLLASCWRLFGEVGGERLLPIAQRRAPKQPMSRLHWGVRAERG